MQDMMAQENTGKGGFGLLQSKISDALLRFKPKGQHQAGLYNLHY